MSLSLIDDLTRSRTDRADDQSSQSEATRYLGAAAHSDAAFRRSVLEGIHLAEFRCKAPEFGIDEQAVIRQCIIADRRAKIRDALLLGVLIVLVISTSILSDLSDVLDNPDDFGLFLNYYAPELIVAIVAGGTILFGYLLFNEHFTLRRRFSRQARDGWNRAAPQAPASRQNLVVYNAYSPFVGSGLLLRDWSFSINLQKTADGDELCNGDPQISVPELTEFVRARLANLAIPALEQYDVLFADGRYVREDSRLMPSPYNLPGRQISDELMTDLAATEETWRRSYLCVAVTDWSGELVLTTYLRFKQGKSHLFAEASHFILPPLKKNYYAVDAMDPALKVRRVTQLALQALLSAPFRLALSPFRVAAIVMEPIHRWSNDRATRKAIRDNPMFNYGARTSIRQLGMENRFRVYFQQLDRDMHRKTIEQCMIDAIVAYLEDHNIDTSDIRERRSTILNSGVVISGGVVNAESLAVGSGARSVVSKLRAMSSSAGKA